VDGLNQIIAEFEKTYPGGPTIRSALSLPLNRPHVLALFGPSGSGKSTILRCIAGLERPDAGRIQCGTEMWFDSKQRRSVPPQSRSVGYLSQHHALFPHLTIAQNIGYALRRVTRQERAEQIKRMTEIWKLKGLEGRYPDQLSGGEQQRVALGQVLLRRPKVLLLDEPLSALDVPTRDQLRGELRRFLRECNLPTLYVTHDPAETLTMGDELAVIVNGAIQQVGSPQAVFNRPANQAVAAIVGVETVVLGRIVDRSDGLVTLDVKGVRIWAVAASSEGEDFYLSIRAEDVMIEKGISGRSSARNHLPGRIKEIRLMGPVAHVKVDCGFLITALVTRQAVHALGLEEGSEVTAVVKATALHLIEVGPSHQRTTTSPSES